MSASATSLVLRSLRVSPEVWSANGRGLPGISACFKHYTQRAEDSSASNLGVGEPPIDESQTQRGQSRSQESAGTSTGAPVGRQDVEATSTSSFDTGESASSKQPKKSRTGGDMSDEGQVHTPNLGKTRSTRDMIQSRGREVEEKLAAEKKSH